MNFYPPIPPSQSSRSVPTWPHGPSGEVSLRPTPDGRYTVSLLIFWGASCQEWDYQLSGTPEQMFLHDLDEPKAPGSSASRPQHAKAKLKTTERGHNRNGVATQGWQREQESRPRYHQPDQQSSGVRNPDGSLQHPGVLNSSQHPEEDYYRPTVGTTDPVYGRPASYQSTSPMRERSHERHFSYPFYGSPLQMRQREPEESPYIIISGMRDMHVGSGGSAVPRSSSRFDTFVTHEMSSAIGGGEGGAILREESQADPRIGSSCREEQKSKGKGREKEKEKEKERDKKGHARSGSYAGHGDRGQKEKAKEKRRH